MKLSHFEYLEHVGESEEWILEPFDLGTINLFVGRNSAGKSRLISVIANLAKLIKGEVKDLFSSGTFTACFSADPSAGLTEYRLRLEKNKVFSESLFVAGVEMFSRDSDGKGWIRATKLKEPLEFEVSSNVLVISAKRDKAQHEFLEPLHEWATSLRRCDFGTSLGKEKLRTIPDLFRLSDRDGELLNPSEIHELYDYGFRKYGQPFDDLILAALAELGYEAKDVGLTALDLPQVKGIPLAVLFVQEKDLDAATTQLTMSQGMFRALALTIQLCFNQLEGKPRTILIDDIGEGLDFERSKALISLLVKQSKKSDFQLLMTTNDRFVMNAIDLSEWAVINRQGSRVRVTNRANSPALFAEFEELGLSNFDFFSTRFFESGVL